MFQYYLRQYTFTSYLTLLVKLAVGLRILNVELRIIQRISLIVFLSEFIRDILVPWQ